MNSAIFHDKHERIWIDDFGPFVFAKVTKLAASDEMKTANMKTVEAIRHQVKKFKFVYFILDTTETEDFTAAKLADFYTHRLADLFKVGLEYVAFLTPKSSTSANTLHAALRSLPLRGPIGMHESFERALHHTTCLWQDRMGRSVI
jgi:hypothetical protein